ncbi:hypothetical protein E2C01_078372 [Portunus trituberculatus]|uniref:Uncharacterized protein n=1 Tax=Portunus trituberculatus TaxID=210409 RepID=A0A5B7IQ17_PORTR|nr:hypothetical protein [Portunus trituberculatus]
MVFHHVGSRLSTFPSLVHKSFGFQQGSRRTRLQYQQRQARPLPALYKRDPVTVSEGGRHFIPYTVLSNAHTQPSPHIKKTLEPFTRGVVALTALLLLHLRASSRCLTSSLRSVKTG